MDWSFMPVQLLSEAPGPILPRSGVGLGGGDPEVTGRKSQGQVQCHVCCYGMKGSWQWFSVDSVQKLQEWTC